MKLREALIALLFLALAATPEARGAGLLWLAEEEAGVTERAELVETVLREALQGDRQQRHVAGRRALSEALSADVEATCLAGIRPCSGPEGALLEALGVQRIAVLRVDADGRRASARVRDPDTDSSETYVVEGQRLRDTLLSLVSEITGATGTLIVQSTPEGAEVRVNDEVLGRTPLERSLPVGVYELGISLRGWFDYGQRVEVRAGDRTLVRAPLERRFADVRLRSTTEGVEFWIDSRPGRVFRPGDVVELEPGPHRVDARAPGYTTRRQDIQLIAGEERELRLNLQLSPETLAARQRDAILARPVRLQAGALIGASTIDWASGSRRLLASDEAPTHADLGLRLDLIHTWRIAELGLFGFGVGTLPRGDAPELDLFGGGSAQVRSAMRTELRFLQPGLRYLVNERFEPNLRTGLAWVQYRGTLDEPGDEGRISRGSAHWQVQGGTRIHLNRLIHLSADMSFSTSLASDDSTMRLAGLLGIGLNLTDLFGVNAALDGLAAPGGTSRRGSAAPEALPDAPPPEAP